MPEKRKGGLIKSQSRSSWSETYEKKTNINYKLHDNYKIDYSQLQQKDIKANEIEMKPLVSFYLNFRA